MKRVFRFILAGILLFVLSVPVCAEASESITQDQVETSRSILQNQVEASRLIPQEQVEDSESILQEQVEASESITQDQVETSRSILQNQVEASELITQDQMETSESILQDQKEMESYQEDSGASGESDDTETGSMDDPDQGDYEEAAWSVPALIKENHIRYIQGPGDGLFYPANFLTRAETVTLLCNILEESEAGPHPDSFSDIPDGKWYTRAVRQLASYGVIHGYPDGTFQPSRAVTRAEFVTMLVNLTGVVPAVKEETEPESTHENLFTDIEGSWAQEAILAAVEQEWIFGYRETDGSYTFRPNRTITRAEAVTICNRLLGRKADLSVINSGRGVLHFPDVREKDWFYPEIMEAATGHSHEITENGEIWTDYNVETTGLSEGFHAAGGLCFTVDSAGQPEKYNAGYYLINSVICHAREDGYALYRESVRGMIVLDGRKYLSDGNVLVSGRTGFYDFDGYTYYINDDGTIAADGSLKYNGSTYRFDAKGRLMTALRSAVENSKTAGLTEQIVLVIKHTLTFWCRAEDGSWRKLMDTYCGYGSRGFADADSRKTGSLTTPTGAFPLILAFGTGSDPGTGLPYRQITKNSYWADETNDWMESPKKVKGEHLIDYAQYKYAVAIGFNRDPYVPERGSAIFIHCKGSRSWSTAGCVSLKEENMLTLMKSLNEGAYIIIVQDEKDLKGY